MIFGGIEMKKRLSIVLILTAILLTFLGINYMERKNYVPKEVPVDESEIGIQIDYMDDHINKQIAFATSKRIETRKLNHDGEVLKTALEDQAYDEIRLMEKERIEEERLEAERIAYEAWLAEQERIAEEERRIEEERRLEEQRRLEEEKRLEEESSKQEESETVDVAVETEDTEEAADTVEESSEVSEEESEEAESVEEPVEEVQEEPESDGGCLTAWGGVYWYGDQKETYYNLDMSYVVYRAQQDGLEGEYWVRDDGCKMFGDYIILACNRDVHPYGSIVMTSLGAGISLDTGGFAYSNPYAVDIATTW